MLKYNKILTREFLEIEYIIKNKKCYEFIVNQYQHIKKISDTMYYKPCFCLQRKKDRFIYGKFIKSI